MSKAQPKGIVLEESFGDPYIWVEGYDHADVLASDEWVLIKAPQLRNVQADARLSEAKWWHRCPPAQHNPEHCILCGRMNELEKAALLPAPKETP